MPVRIRLSRKGTKKRPFYRIVVADSRRSRDGKFIDQIGTYNPILSKDNPERVKLNADKANEWIKKGAQPSDRIKLFLSNVGIGEKPLITEKTKKHLPKKKTQERLEAAKVKKLKVEESKSEDTAESADSVAKETKKPDKVESPTEADGNEIKKANNAKKEKKSS